MENDKSIYCWNNFLSNDQINHENDKIYKKKIENKFKDFKVNELHNYILMLYKKINVLYNCIFVNNEKIKNYNKSNIFLFNLVFGTNINNKIQKYTDENIIFSVEIVESKKEIHYIKILIANLLEQNYLSNLIGPESTLELSSSSSVVR